ncbi:taste receptor type 2 member 123-like [Bombina bombina]|uniref:taste receptor type 2 member 123-like n=1 Tax=Bombina bombina TaxID=8345 RepID=UPI00235AE9DB|nr:taste receptor type 2 member 123-like [Bombina bombina]
MAEQDMELLYSLAAVFMSIFAAEIIAGISISLFIVAVNVQDWYKGEMLNSCDKILLALGVSNFFYPLLSGLMLCLSLLQPQSISEVYYQVGYLLTLFTVLSSSWLTALLCFFYCVKIVHFKAGLTHYIKLKIDLIVPRLILATELASAIGSVHVAWDFTKEYSANCTNITAENSSLITFVSKKNVMHIAIPLIPSIITPFLIVMASTMCVIWSLFQHTRHMAQNMTQASRLRVHRRAAWTMVSLLFLYIMFYMTEVLLTFDALNAIIVLYIGTLILMFSCSPLQSIVLLLGNSKLLQKYQKLLQCMSSKIKPAE